ncbi:7-carboxy-7-deazaguanine synthase [Lachnospiraceae bacterium]|nr:7-carboxy-7-deazaguanine synthase [Lachnospiraceae bacterium]
MFLLEEFYRDAYGGNAVNINEFCIYLKGFSNVIIWGAGNLGKAIEEKLRELGIEITLFWDIKFHQLKECNGKPVIETYTGGFDKETTLVIFGIGNVPVGPFLLHEMERKGWKNIIKGDAILQGIICPFTNGKPLDASICNKWDICSVCACERLMNIVKSNVPEHEEPFVLDRVHFIINNFCNLKCTHCNRFMNSYPNEKKTNLDVEIIREDIDKLMDALDAVGVIILFGGEPFLHPQLSGITEKILEKENFGSLLINTNGIAPVKEEQLRGLEDGRVRVAFSNYINAVTPAQQRSFYKNLKYMEGKGISAKAQNEVPTWFMPTTLCDNHVSEEQMIINRNACDFPYLFVYNHKIFPCTIALTLYDLGIADYEDDYVDIQKANSRDELRRQIKEMMARKFFRSCGHCDSEGGGIINAAGEQGFSERYALPKKNKEKRNV